MDVVGGEVGQGPAAAVFELDPAGPSRARAQPGVAPTQRSQLGFLIGADYRTGPGGQDGLVDGGQADRERERDHHGHSFSNPRAPHSGATPHREGPVGEAG
ncbi:MAG: hypothetical protein ABI568_06295 [Pseudarthrobacter sp.]